MFARQLAMQQLCHDLQDGMACGHCQSCKAFLQGTHGDLLSLQVPEGKTAIGIDQVREATHFLQQTALYGAAKLLLVRDADQMTLAAANSLLKTLEEPPGNALVLLSSAEAWLLPPTIRSRCQLLRLPRVEKDQAIEWLRSEIQVTSADAEHLLNMAQGRAVAARVSWRTQRAWPQRKRLLQAFRRSVSNRVAHQRLGPASRSACCYRNCSLGSRVRCARSIRIAFPIARKAGCCCIDAWRNCHSGSNRARRPVRISSWPSSSACAVAASTRPSLILAGDFYRALAKQVWPVRVTP